MTSRAITITQTVVVDDGAGCQCCVPSSPGLIALMHIGAPRKAGTTGVVSDVITPNPGRATSIMDLKVDQELPLSFTFTDELGNTKPAPADLSQVFTSSDPTAVAIVVADDGTTVARSAGGTLGVAAVVHGEATWTDESGNARSVTGDEAVAIVSGDTERATFVAGPAREITPDV